FFQAEDGIRDLIVTGVQTCALPICRPPSDARLQIQLRMGQANVRRWVDDIMPLLQDGDPLGTDDFATHRVPLDEAPQAYEMFQRSEERRVGKECRARRWRCAEEKGT